MNDDVVVKVEHVSKKFAKSLKRSMLYGGSDIARNAVGMSSHPEKLRKGEFWAVDDVSFELKKGEALGLIGPNGSGKSTLLKMLNGIYWPDKGKITIKGKVGALIEVGAGFHPMLTGRENIYVNAAILGMTKKETDAKLDDIIKFADIGDFLDTPVKFYSSGMYVRLGFAVAVHCEPDVLLVDEVLAVGDREFQLKCFKKMHKLRKDDGISIILVSHNEYTMRVWADTSVVLQNGKSVYQGKGDDAISFYINMLKASLEPQASVFKESGTQIINKVYFKNSAGEEISKIKTGEPLIIEFIYSSNRVINNPIVGINFYNTNGLCTGLSNIYEDFKLSSIVGKGVIRLTIDPADLPIDVYRCSIALYEDDESNALQWQDLDNKIVVERPSNAKGYLKFKQKWEIITT